MQIKIKKLQEVLNIKFKNLDLLLQALTHKSYDTKKNYEKLEFLGDRVLGLVISKKLLELYPDEKVGILDKKFASLVNKNKCFEVGKILNLNDFILVGNSGKKSSKIESKIISDCCESIIGAIYLEKGFDVAKKFILKVWSDFLKYSEETIIDPKTKLQEYSLKQFKTLPIYKLISNTGPRHKPNFKVGVKVKNSKFIYANGSSKKKAQQVAANELLKNLIKL
tara:strand:+ start:2055 stop:2723 length:669 start_codon:yes stop_codon:yes gene_type:complete